MTLTVIEGYVCEQCGGPIHDSDDELAKCPKCGSVRGRRDYFARYRGADGSIDITRWAIDHGELGGEPL